MSPNKYTGPWAPGMLTTDGQRIVVVDVAWIVAVRYDWIRQGGTGYDRWCIDSELGRGMRPDFGDGATVGALAGVVREMYGDPNAHATWDGDLWHVNARIDLDADAAFDGVAVADTEALAWLAAYHAHPSVASSASPPVRGDATDLGVDRG